MGWNPFRDISREWEKLNDQLNEATGLDRFYEQVNEAIGVDYSHGQTEGNRQAVAKAIILVLELLGYDFDPITPDNAYYGVPYAPQRRGYPIQLRAEVVADGSPPSDLVFVGHAPTCMFDSLQVTMSGVSLVEDVTQFAGVGVSLIQVDPNGQRVYVSGVERNWAEDGSIVREELILPAKSPLTAYETFGGPVEPDLPMFLFVRPVGDWSAVTGYTGLRVQVALNLLCQTAT